MAVLCAAAAIGFWSCRGSSGSSSTLPGAEPARDGGADVSFHYLTRFETEPAGRPDVTLSRDDSGQAVVLTAYETDGGALAYRSGHRVGGSVRWSEPAQPIYAPGESASPTVALNADGYVVELHERTQGGIDCLFGRMDWDTLEVTFEPSGEYPTGQATAFLPQISMNDDGWFVAVHQTGPGVSAAQESPLYYRVGHIDGAWDSNPEMLFANGVTPDVTINDDKTVVVAYHQGGALWSRVGVIEPTSGEIEWLGEAVSYVDRGWHPKIALGEDDTLIAIHSSNPSLAHARLFQRVGAVEDGRIIWSRFGDDEDECFTPIVDYANRDRVFNEDRRYVQPSVAVDDGWALTVLLYAPQSSLRYSASRIVDRRNWMYDNIDTLGHKPLRDVTIPGSHDAGMFQYRHESDIPLIGGCAGGYNITTQTEDMLKQLDDGCRFFDLRPTKYLSGGFFAGHYTGIDLYVDLGDLGEIYLGEALGGASGAALCFWGPTHCDDFPGAPACPSIAEQVRDYFWEGDELTGRPRGKDLVILKFSHYLVRSGTGNFDYDWGFRRQEMRHFMSVLYAFLEPWLYKDAESFQGNGFLGAVPLEEFLPEGGHEFNGRMLTGRVLPIFERPTSTLSISEAAWAELLDEFPGFYDTGDLQIYDSYSNSDSVSSMSGNQLNKMMCHETGVNNSLFLLSWTLTKQNTCETNPTILKLANFANAALWDNMRTTYFDSVDEWACTSGGQETPTPVRRPNIVYADYVQGALTDVALWLNELPIDETLDCLIDFDVEGFPAGTIISEVHAEAPGGIAGPVIMGGFLPGTGGNSAVLFDSANPTGGDVDLGTPNETVGGPGVGSGGEQGQPFENLIPQGNVLIMAEDRVDADGDGLVDEPNDADVPGMVFVLDFTLIDFPFAPPSVTVLDLLALDQEQGAPESVVRFYGLEDELLGEFSLPPAGDNGVRRHVFGEAGVGIEGVTRMEIELNQSGAIDDIRFRMSR